MRNGSSLDGEQVGQEPNDIPAGRSAPHQAERGFARARLKQADQRPDERGVAKIPQPGLLPCQTDQLVRVERPIQHPKSAGSNIRHAQGPGQDGQRQVPRITVS